MKKFTLLVLLIAGLCTSQISAQFDASMLSQASSLLSQGDQAGSGAILGQVASMLGQEAETSKTDFGAKLGSQLGLLNSVLPALSNGNADVGVVQKIINTVSMLVGANQLSKMIGGGGSGLLGNTAALTSNIGLIQNGIGALGDVKGVNKITKGLNKITKKSSKLDLEGVAGQAAEKTISKKLTKSLGVLGGLI